MWTIFVHFSGFYEADFHKNHWTMLQRLVLKLYNIISKYSVVEPRFRL